MNHRNSLVNVSYYVTANQLFLERSKEIKEQNRKIYHRIVDARVKRTGNSFKRDESVSKNLQTSLLMQDIKHKAKIATQNKKMAVKLFTTKSSYRTLEFEKMYKTRQNTLHRMSRFI